MFPFLKAEHREARRQRVAPGKPASRIPVNLSQSLSGFRVCEEGDNDSVGPGIRNWQNTQRIEERNIGL